MDTMTNKGSTIKSYQEHIQTLSKGENLIVGIYNYCDRWCERCPMSKHCSVFYSKNETTENQDWDDLSKISEIFSLTMEMLQEIAEEAGLDITDLPEVEIPEHQEGEVEKLSREYDKKIYQWIIANKDLIEEKADTFVRLDEQKYLLLRDSFEVINYYSSMIGAKIMRAMANPLDAELDEIERYDQDGSAKVALLSIDRSLIAFNNLLAFFPEKETDFLRFLASLAMLKRKLLQVFPLAMDFKRPGFDD
jgi:hypothetical protein